MQSVKAVRFQYKPSKEILSLLKIFREMCNDAVRIAIDQDAHSRFDLIEKSYRHLKGYGLHTHYILSACEVAYSIYGRWRQNLPEATKQIAVFPQFKKCGVLNELLRRGVRIPYVKRPFLKLDNQTYRLDYLLLRIPTEARRFVFIALNGSLYYRSFLGDKSLKRGSITITDSSVIITFSKEIVPIETVGRVGIDVNERNVTWSDTEGMTEQVDVSEVPELKERYRQARAKIGQRTGRDRRTSQRLYVKYGRREKNRTIQRLHQVSRAIVNHAGSNRLVIVMEELKGIRKLYRRGNGQGRSYRGRMNSWTFREMQRQIEYKAAWDGIPVSYVSPRGTSRNCLCGSRMEPLEERKMLCPRCSRLWDRDVIASRNIMAAPPVRAARPDR